MGDESEPPQSAVEKIDGCGAVAGVVQVSPVRARRGARPKPREMAGNSPPARAPDQDSPETRTRWRREWDSNPRYPSGYTRSPGACLQPLGHLSVSICGGEGGIRTRVHGARARPCEGVLGAGAGVGGAWAPVHPSGPGPSQSPNVRDQQQLGMRSLARHRCATPRASAEGAVRLRT